MSFARAESVISRANHQAVWPWQAEPYKLWSLLEMNILEAHRIAYIARFITETREKSREKVKEQYLGEKDLATLTHAIGEIHTELEELGLESAQDQAQRISLSLKEEHQPTVADIIAALDDLNNRFEDALRRKLCFILPSDKVSYYQKPQQFGLAVSERFPEATLDIEEAGKCLALQRGTATVFHLMRVMEAGLKAIAAELDIPYAPSWESYLKQIKTHVDADWSKKSRKLRKQQSFFSDVLAHLEAVKLAWRNPTMHIRNHYTPEAAEQIFGAVRGFMTHLAEALPKLKRRKKSGHGESASPLAAV